MSGISTTRKDHGLVALSSLAYRLLLLAYPARFRREYGPHMAQAFRDCCLRSLRQSGPPGMLALWSLTLVDWLKSMIDQHLLKGVHMSKARFIRISGWALILGGAALLLGTITMTAVSGASSQYDARYRPTDPLFEAISMFLLPSAVILITIGIAGLYARFGTESGRLGRLGMVLGVVGGMITFAALLGLFINNLDSLWVLMMYSLAAMFGGLVLFGIEALGRHTLPRGNYLPVLAGISFPVFVVISAVYEAATGRWLEISDLVTGAMFLVTAFGLLALGQILRSEAVETPLPA